MEIGALNSVIYNPKELLIRKTVSDNNSVASNSFARDQVSLSQNSAKSPKIDDTHQAMSNLGEKIFNNPIINHYLAYRQDPAYKPIIAEVDRAVFEKAGINDLVNVAVKATKENNKNLDSGETLAVAYRSILASVTKNHYSDPNFFNGEKDKILHYFVSGSMTLQVYNTLPLLPSGLKANIAGKSVLTIGWLKEVGSIPGNGYGADDMQANKMGIEAVKKRLKEI